MFTQFLMIDICVIFNVGFSGCHPSGPPFLSLSGGLHIKMGKPMRIYRCSASIRRSIIAAAT
jgi:hypothetical protein